MGSCLGVNNDGNGNKGYEDDGHDIQRCKHPTMTVTTTVMMTRMTMMTAG
jgi:hypothetical protein